MRMQANSQEVEELKALVENAKLTLKDAENARKTLAEGKAIANSQMGGVNEEDGLAVARRKNEELRSKNQKLILNNVEASMKQVFWH